MTPINAINNKLASAVLTHLGVGKLVQCTVPLNTQVIKICDRLLRRVYLVTRINRAAPVCQLHNIIYKNRVCILLPEILSHVGLPDYKFQHICRLVCATVSGAASFLPV